ncbi:MULTISPECIES: phosphatase PAP2 family protein [unclassified Janthinobacterium]|uniref:phosphatase PAP2 family protein n=1 Tax=unclassified Janthinobacterium TaxID=2610881 RepID=UPI000348D19D|nr:MULTISPECIES: phosphatase PAP2 family protein [unclassified Janthinobacterium]MEC5163820.1 membrane-associated phospholipid phosphatase [Janthinobacterium sp. CG_S6]
MTSSAASKLKKFLAARLTPDGEFGLYLTVGVALLLAAAWIFGGIADAVFGAARIGVLDVRISQWFNRHAIGWVTRVMVVVTHLHSVAGIVVLTALLALYFHRQKARFWLLTLLVAMPGVMVLNVLLKYTYLRARPSFEEPVFDLALSSYSFPSGHTATATLLYALLGAYLVCRTPKWGARLAIVLAAALMAALVGLSRVYLGAHYPSDVLAAMAESCGWLAVCITACSHLRRRLEAANK